MHVRRIGRRQLLVGAGGFTLGLPCLTSLMPQSRAANPPGSVRRLLAITSHHGGAWAENTFPEQAALTDFSELFAGHTIGRGDLVADPVGDDVVVSNMFTAPSSVLTPQLLSKLNVMAGLDIMYYLDHHRGAFLGNFDARAFFFEGSSPGELIPSIDQVLAWSDKFYPTLDGVLTRSLHLNRSTSWGFTDPTNASGEIVEVPAAPSALAAFDQIFVPDGDPEFEARRARREFVVDKVHASYQALRTGAHGDASRLSASDRVRLDEHLERIFELEHKITTLVACGDLDPPAEDVAPGHPGISNVSADIGAAITAHGIYNDVIVAGVMCGTTRIATVHVRHMFSDVFTDYFNWHNEVEHLCQDDAVAQDRMVASQRRVFEHVFLDLATKLDVDEGDGTTYLDNSLLMMCPQFGCRTHWSDSLPIVTAGSAGGHFSTGNFVDYRNHDADSLGGGGYRRPGIAYNQFLANVLQAMGLEPEDYERGGIPGYGVPTVRSQDLHPEHILASASEPLPFIAG